MADHEALVNQSEEAYAAGAAYLDQADNWLEFSNENGVVASVTVTETGPVLKVEGSLNKNPQFVVKFIGGNLVRLRADHAKHNSGTEYVKTFDDRSHVVRESSNHPQIGELTQYKYYRTKVSDDGSLTVIATTANLPEYPQGHSNLVFFILRVTPTADGSHFKVVMKSHTTLQLDEDAKKGVALDIRDYYAAVIAEIQAAPAE